jgi:NAD+ diphosphatase
MIAFTATYAAGQIRIDDQEVIDANWFTADKLPTSLPAKYSIARTLIDWFIEKQNATSLNTRTR